MEKQITLILSEIFFYEDNIYFINDKKIVQLNLFTGAANTIPIPGVGIVAYNGRYLYFLNERHRILRYDKQKE